jgi:hypothetical protein
MGNNAGARVFLHGVGHAGRNAIWMVHHVRVIWRREKVILRPFQPI